MAKIKYIWSNFINSFWCVRLLCFVIVQLTVIHQNVNSLMKFCQQVMCPVTPYALPFLLQNYYFVFIYGICCVYFFSEVPYMQSKQLYSIMRMGRKKWLLDKLLRILVTSLSLVLLEVLLIVVVLLPQIEWNLDWGKVWYSLALSDAAVQYDVSIIVPYQIVNAYTPMQAMGKTLLLMFLVTAFIGFFMYVWSLYFSRSSSVFAASILCVMTLVFANLSGRVDVLAFITPLEWMDLMVLDGEICKAHPTFLGVVICVLLFCIGVGIISIHRINHMDIQLVNEE